MCISNRARDDVARVTTQANNTYFVNRYELVWFLLAAYWEQTQMDMDGILKYKHQAIKDKTWDIINITDIDLHKVHCILQFLAHICFCFLRKHSRLGINWAYGTTAIWHLKFLYITTIHFPRPGTLFHKQNTLRFNNKYMRFSITVKLKTQRSHKQQQKTPRTTMSCTKTPI